MICVKYQSNHELCWKLICYIICSISLCLACLLLALTKTNYAVYRDVSRARPCVLGRRDSDSGRTKFERVRQFGHTDNDFGRTKSKHWRPIGFKNFVSNLANEIQINWTPQNFTWTPPILKGGVQKTPTFEILDTTLVGCWRYCVVQKLPGDDVMAHATWAEKWVINNVCKCP